VPIKAYHVFLDDLWHFWGVWALGMYSRWLKFLSVIWKGRQACIGGWICFFLLILLLNVLEG